MEKTVAVSVIVGCLAIAAAIYLKPSDYDRCVDRYTSTYLTFITSPTDKAERNLLAKAIVECAN